MLITAASKEIVGDIIFTPTYVDENMKSEHSHNTNVSTPVPSNLVETNCRYLMNTIKDSLNYCFLGSLSAKSFLSLANCWNHITNITTEKKKPTIS